MTSKVETKRRFWTSSESVEIVRLIEGLFWLSKLSICVVFDWFKFIIEIQRLVFV
jgi:hypothetical protein